MDYGAALAAAASKFLSGNPHRRSVDKFESGGGRTVQYCNSCCYFGSIRRRRSSLMPGSPNNRFKSSHLAFSTASNLEFSHRTSPEEVRKEIQDCYDLIQKLGRGVIYLGSSRINDEHQHYSKALELARDVAKLLECTTWTGAGPGLMDAAIKGALEAGKPVGGFKIAKESGEWTSSNFHPYLPPDTYLTCRFFSARKHGLVDAAVRNTPSDMTAVVAFPGGIGTLDEVFEVLALIQLERIGSELPVPFLLMDYDSFYSKLLEFMDECEKWGTIARGQFASLCKVCNSNGDALEYLANFYNIQGSKRKFDHQMGQSESCQQDRI
ncbi:hypothetical protein AXF42_Ash014120 [Apostasia shenzhenica]|uniref:Uncharacterized protein n=1 Tax=Apostasia shenzhenica TaxID=1088818 RepID=A0A2I0A9E0_9ASPA|nr:hypothetical protein AXF42_Ash014120 [Apostasia shenzhenica]